MQKNQLNPNPNNFVPEIVQSKNNINLQQMEPESKDSGRERLRTTNIVGETKKDILDETVEKKKEGDLPVTDAEVKKAVEMINPDPNSLKSRG